MKKVFFVVLPLLLVVTSVMFVGCKDEDQEFAYDIVLVMLTPEAGKKASDGGKVFAPEDFPEVALSDVRIIDNSPNTFIMRLTLQVPSRENVLNAVQLLSVRNDIFSAELCYSGSIPTPVK